MDKKIFVKQIIYASTLEIPYEEKIMVITEMIDNLIIDEQKTIIRAVKTDKRATYLSEVIKRAKAIKRKHPYKSWNLCMKKSHASMK